MTWTDTTHPLRHKRYYKIATAQRPDDAVHVACRTNKICRSAHTPVTPLSVSLVFMSDFLIPCLGLYVGKCNNYIGFLSNHGEDSHLYCQSRHLQKTKYHWWWAFQTFFPPTMRCFALKRSKSRVQGTRSSYLTLVLHKNRKFIVY